LNGGGSGDTLGRRTHDIVRINIRREGKFQLPDIADGDSVGSAGRLNHGAEGAKLTVLHVDAHLARRIVGAVPELNVRVEGATFGR